MEKIENSLQLRNLSKTRWTARAESIEAVVASYEAILEVLKEISQTREFGKGMAKALGLYKKLMSVDFIISLYFMKNIMRKLKILTLELETPNRNAIDCIALIESYIKIFNNINKDSDSMDNLITAASNFATKLGVNVTAAFEQNHRIRLLPRRLDDNPTNQVEWTLYVFYRKEFTHFLDRLNGDLQDNVKALKFIMMPIYSVFKFPLDKKNIDKKTIDDLVQLFPVGHRPDAGALKIELELIFDICNADPELLAANDEMDFIIKKINILRSSFELSYKLCHFIVTSSYSVATNERMFSILKLIKNYLRSTSTDERTDNLLLLKSSRDIMDQINIENLVTLWFNLKDRRINMF